MSKYLLFSILLSVCFLFPVHSDAKRRRVFKRKWSISLVNGHTFRHMTKKFSKDASTWKWQGLDGQMNWYFSSLEISRNMGYYEMGAKIQNFGVTFVSPFFKWNWIKNNSRADFLPSLTFGIVPSHIMGAWLRLGLGLSLNRYISIAPFFGAYAWYKIKDDSTYFTSSNVHLNAGLRVNLYY